MGFDASSIPAGWSEQNRLPSVSNYFTGASWYTQIPHFGRVIARRIYSGIDVAWYGSQRQLEYDFIVSPGADPKKVRLRLDGASNLRISAAGDLIIRTASSEFRMQKPIAFQDGQFVACAFEIIGKSEIGFRLGKYDRKKELTIDPVILNLSYSTLVGGTGPDTAEAVWVDAAGAVTIAGTSSSADFPPSGFGVRSGGDAMVAQLNASGTALVFSTFIGGTGADIARAVSLDAAGNVLITGVTESSNFPLASQTQASLSGASDAFITKLNPTGTGLIYSTYLGGSNLEDSYAIAINQATGEAFIGGDTRSNNFPTTSPYKGTLNGTVEGFVAKFGPTGTRLFSTYWGGPAFQPSGTHSGVTVRGLVLDSAGNPVFTGTGGAVLPVSAGAAVATGNDSFVKGYIAKLSAAGANVLLCTYTQGAGIFPRAIAVDPSNRMYIAGHYQFAARDAGEPPRDLTDDVFWAALNATGTSFTAIGTLVANSEDRANGIAVSGAEPFVHVAGYTKSSDFPKNNTIAGTPGTVTSTEAFVAKINPGTAENIYVTLLGGTADDVATGVAVSAAGTFVSGYTSSVGGTGAFPTTVGALRRTGAGFDAWISKLTESACTYALSAPSFDAPATGASSSVNVTTGCAWTATTAEPWISIVTPAGSGNGPVSFTVAPNTTNTSRSGSIAIGGQSFTVNQAAPQGCVIALSENSANVTASGAVRAVPVSSTSPDCSVAVVSNVPWIKVFTVSTYIELTIDTNATASPRSGTVTVAGQTYTVNQAGGTCVFNLGTDSANRGPDGALSGIPVGLTASNSSCAWVTSSPAFWAQPDPRSGSGNRTVSVTVIPNFATRIRNTSVAIAGKSFTVTQTPSVESENHRFVRLLYFSFFGRTAGANEVQGHVNNLINGTSRADLVINFMNSDEFNIGGRFVAGLYVGLLNRDAEYPGWQYQRNAMVAGGTSPLNLTTAFINSPEFAARFGSLSDADFVRHLYSYVLLRPASQTEVDFHVGTLSPAFTRAHMAGNFLQSFEFRNGTGPRLTAFLISAALQLRDPAPEERIARIQQLGSGTPIKTLIETVLSTPSFRGLLD
jgi:hypothetical protein